MFIGGRLRRSVGTEETAVTDRTDRRTDEGTVARVSARLRRHRAPSVVTIGTFDGVHAGHRAVVAHARRVADLRGLRTIAVTFTPRPDRVFSKDGPLDIVALPERVARLRAAGADDVVVLPFDRGLAAVTAERFAELLVRDLGMRALCVGEDFALGRAREAGVAELRLLGLEVLAHPLVRCGPEHQKVSSSAIRHAIARRAGLEQVLRAA